MLYNSNCFFHKRINETAFLCSYNLCPDQKNYKNIGRRRNVATILPLFSVNIGAMVLGQYSSVVRRDIISLKTPARILKYVLYQNYRDYV